ncbi:CNNM domain-containing protein [Clostridium pasteurianum]|uniref:CBS domain-containing protein n=1 Tax=Clostridium pasteurianum BC1 TaxID=86416 RepID=R4K7H6_CLOPA|nr:CNNM domain-containing protein [Clostridium pasteurianum]AGK97666.1 CBS domain-containing protein [Clostridium pasteurianum BC1]
MSKNNNRKSTAKSRRKWILTILIWSVLISSGISLLSDSLLSKVNMLVAFIILAFIIIVGIIFDIIGIAVTAADETPFHAMASKKINGAKIAIKLVRNADKVSTFCNDVVGDISGIVSGSVGFFIAQKLIHEFTKLNSTSVNVAIGAIVASITICGKSIGKTYALENNNIIVSKVSKLLYLIVKDR